jgi:F-type H+-transporting ATPase subunit delta
VAKRIGTLAKRYAKALLNVVGAERPQPGQRSAAQQLAEELTNFTTELFQSSDAKNALLSPMFKREDRKEALLALAQHAGLSETGVQFLGLVADRERLPHLEEIAAAFSQLADEAAKVVRVEVLTANAVNPAEAAEIERGLSQKVEGNPEFHWSVDPSLIGGLVVRYGGKIIDGSIRGKLERLEQELLR